jgi:hypothetical protein
VKNSAMRDKYQNKMGVLWQGDTYGQSKNNNNNNNNN